MGFITIYKSVKPQMCFKCAKNKNIIEIEKELGKIKVLLIRTISQPNSFFIAIINNTNIKSVTKPAIFYNLLTFCVYC